MNILKHLGSSLTASTISGSSYLGKLASTAKDPKITRAFVKLVQEMWKGASNIRTGYSSNHGVAEPAIFRREMTVFAPKFGGYDQVGPSQNFKPDKEKCKRNLNARNPTVRRQESKFEKSKSNTP